MRQYTVRKQASESELQALTDILHSRVAAQTYWNRGIVSEKLLEEWTKTTDLLPEDELYDVKSAAQLIEKHVNAGDKIVVYGDYDADGALAASILWRFLSKVLNAQAIVYIPDRHEEGYGLNKNALETLADQGYKLIISVDCGVRDRELIEAVTQEKEIDILVTDHHQPGTTFPTCITVHPLYPEHESQNRYTSGAVVVWKLVRYLESKLKLGHGYSDSVIDLAGISVVTDMMPLTGENRAILKKAIAKLRVLPHPGIKAIMDIAQVRAEEVNAYHIGYIIGPRLNASGRIGDQYTSTRLLCTDKQELMRTLAATVQEVNMKRQLLTKEILENADKTKVVINDKLIIAIGEKWDDGIIGLVAGKLMNLYDKPTLVITIDTEQKIAKGSARSLGEFNITGFLEETNELWERYGGHAGAAGFTLKNLDTTITIEKIASQLHKNYESYMPISQKEIDALITCADLTDDFFEAMAKLEPYGQGNPLPLYAVRGKVGQFSTVGQMRNHVKIEIETTTGTITAIYFDAVEKISLLHQGDEIVFVGKPKQEEFRGRMQISFIIEDLVPSSELRNQ